MYNLIFEILTDPLGLPISPVWEYLLLLLLNEIAFQIAWAGSPGGRWGSEIHWAIRLPTFVIMWAVAYAIIYAIKWLIQNWIIFLYVLGGFVIIAGIATIIVFFQIKKNKKML